MSKIRGKDTKPEMVVRRFLHLNGFRYRLHDKSLPGRPDIKLPKYNAVFLFMGASGMVILIAGYIKCRNRGWLFGVRRLQLMRREIKKGVATLHEMGWKVFILWECELKPTKREAVLNALIARIKEN